MIPRFFWLYSNIISLLRIKINDVYTQQPKPGQPSKGILISCIARCVLIAVCFGSLSCWNVQLLFWNSRFAYIDILRTAVRRYAALLCPISVLEYSFRSIETIFNVLRGFVALIWSHLLSAEMSLLHRVQRTFAWGFPSPPAFSLTPISGCLFNDPSFHGL